MTQPAVVDDHPMSWHDEAAHRLSAALFRGGQLATLRAVPDLIQDRPAFEVALSGEIDLADKPDLDALIARFRVSDHTRARVDLRAVTFFGSTGLSFLAGLGRIAHQGGGTLTLVGPWGICLRVIKIVKMDEIVLIQP